MDHEWPSNDLRFFTIEDEISGYHSGGLPGFLEELESSGRSAQCLSVWESGSIAYRCKTCQTTDSSAICKSCFKKGNHLNHDYVMYRSEVGGCCDCGDGASWSPEGFCSDHSQSNSDPPAEIPPHLKQITARKLALLLDAFAEETTDETFIQMCQWLRRLCRLSAFQHVICELMVQEGRLQDQSHSPAGKSAPLARIWARFHEMTKEQMAKLTPLFLLLSYDADFKAHFCKEIAKAYPAAISSLSTSQTPNFAQFENSLDQILVQLFNHSASTFALVRDNDLIDNFVAVLMNITEASLTSGGELPKVVDIRSQLIRGMSRQRGFSESHSHGCIVRPIMDLRLVLSNPQALPFLMESKPHMYTAILRFLALLQGINPYRKNVFENDVNEVWSQALTLELHAMSVVGVMCEQSLKPSAPPCRESMAAILKAAKGAFSALRDWCTQKHPLPSLPAGGPTRSLHIPLHRSASLLAATLVQVHSGKASACLDLISACASPEQALAMAAEPILIFAWLSEIRVRAWFHQGSDLSHIERVYRCAFWHDRSLDLDLFLLQVLTCAMEGPERPQGSEGFAGRLVLLAGRFFGVEKLASEEGTDGDWWLDSELGKVQDFLKFLLLMVRWKGLLGLSELESLRHAVIQWLCVSDRTHSGLCSALPSTMSKNPSLDAVLLKVADYHPPNVSSHGYYALKAELWAEFDPLFPYYSPTELQSAASRRPKSAEKSNVTFMCRAPNESFLASPLSRVFAVVKSDACEKFVTGALNLACNLATERENSAKAEPIARLSCHILATELSALNSSSSAAEPFKQKLLKMLPNNCSLLEVLESMKSTFSESRDLVELISFIQAKVDTPSQTSLKSQSNTEASEKEWKEQKRKRQQQILAEFQAKQQIFNQQWMEEAMAEEEEETEPSLSQAEHRGDSSAGMVCTDPETHESCALCHVEFGANNAPCGRLAQIQNYQMVSSRVTRSCSAVHTLKKALAVLGDPSGDPSGDQSQTLIAFSPGNSLDASKTVHIRCCGHQMHETCLRHYLFGPGVVPSSRKEFLCPVCRRLANTLVPVVPPSVKDGLRQEGSLRVAAPAWGPEIKLLMRQLESCLLHRPPRRQQHRQRSPAVWLHTWNSLLTNLVHADVALHHSPTEQEHQQALQALARLAPVLGTVPELVPCLRSAHLSLLQWLALVPSVDIQRVLPRDGVPKSLPNPYLQFWSPAKLDGTSAAAGSSQEAGGASPALSPAQEVLQGEGRQQEQKEVSLQPREQLLQWLVRQQQQQEQADSPQQQEEAHELQARQPQQQQQQQQEQQQQQQEGEEGEQESGWLLALLQWQERIRDGERQEQERAQEEQQLQEEHQRLLLAWQDELQEIEDEAGPSLDLLLDLHQQQQQELTQEDLEQQEVQELLEGTAGSEDDAGTLQEEPETDSDGDEDWTADLRAYLDPDDSRQGSADVSSWGWGWEVDFPVKLTAPVLESDPFSVLAGLLMTHAGLPSLPEALKYASLAFDVAAAQAHTAALELDPADVADPARSASDVAEALLTPFLRRTHSLLNLLFGPTRLEFHGLPLPSPSSCPAPHPLLCHLAGPKRSNSANLAALCGSILAERPASLWLRHYRSQKEASQSQSASCHVLAVRRAPEFAPLPSLYQDLLLSSLQTQCEKCRSVPRKPAVCLLCGKQLCCASPCCRDGANGELYTHTMQGEGGVGLFLLVKSTQVLSIRRGKMCSLPSIYLDAHGEEDLNMARGRPLFLNDLRLSELRRVWVNASFDFQSRIVHNSIPGSWEM